MCTNTGACGRLKLAISEVSKTRVLSFGMVCMLHDDILAVLLEHRLVTDRRTDGQAQSHSIYDIPR